MNKYTKYYTKALKYHREDDDAFRMKAANVHDGLPHLIHADMLEEQGHDHLAKHIREAVEDGDIEHAVSTPSIHWLLTCKKSPYMCTFGLGHIKLTHNHVDELGQVHRIDYTTFPEKEETSTFSTNESFIKHRARNIIKDIDNNVQ